MARDIVDADAPHFYWCYTHQTVEPLSWTPHPDHLRVGPMTAAAADGWAAGCSPWRGEVLPLEADEAAAA
jgi:hypothetical protein